MTMHTCVVMSKLANLPEPISVGAEPVNEVIVIGKDAESLVYHLAQVIDSLDVGVLPGKKGIPIHRAAYTGRALCTSLSLLRPQPQWGSSGATNQVLRNNGIRKASASLL